MPSSIAPASHGGEAARGRASSPWQKPKFSRKVGLADVGPGRVGGNLCNTTLQWFDVLNLFGPHSFEKEQYFSFLFSGGGVVHGAGQHGEVVGEGAVNEANLKEASLTPKMGTQMQRMCGSLGDIRSGTRRSGFQREPIFFSIGVKFQAFIM